jgi:GNAT superfamily N-acetyltransferase
MTAEPAYRTFRRGDLGPLTDLIARTLANDPISPDWFTEYVVLEPNFDPDGLIVAEAAEGIIGFVYAVRGHSGQGGQSIPVNPDGGWITVGAVDPAARNHGVGTELVVRAKAFLRDAGCAWANVSGYPPAYFWPGVDADVYPDALRLLTQNGFRTLYKPVAMDLSLATYAQPEAVLKLRETREREGYTFSAATTDDVPEACAFATEGLAPDWGEVIRAAVVRSGRPERVLLSRDPGGAVVGFATYGAYRGIVERFGPFGVAEDQRGRGLGKILLHATMSQMRSEGAHGAWFLWTGKDSPAGQLYLNTGFTITRTFHVLQADLAEE